MKNQIITVLAALLLSSLASEASAAIYGTFSYPAGYNVLGAPVTVTYTFSITIADDADDIVGVAVRVDGTEPMLIWMCPAPIDFVSSGWQAWPNLPNGLSLGWVGTWEAWCPGIYYVLGTHLFFLDNGESYLGESLALYGFF